MRLHITLLQYFLFIYVCYCHNLNRADPVTIKQSESPVTIGPHSKHIETTNVQENDEYIQDTNEARFRATHDLRQPVQEYNEDDKYQNDEQVQYITPSVDTSSQNQIPLSIQNDFMSPSTPVDVISTTEVPINHIPISDDKLNQKVVHNDFITPAQVQIKPPSTDTFQQNRLEEALSSTQSHYQEKLKPISDHISSPSDNTIQNSNSLDLKLDQLSQVSETIPNESHIPAPTPSRILRSATSKLHHKTHTHPRHARTNHQQPENISIIDVNQSENLIIEQSNESSLKPEETLRSSTTVDLSPQLPAHDPIFILNEQNTSTKEGSNKSEKLILNEEIENNTTFDSFLTHDTKPHLPRILENEEKISIAETITYSSPTVNETNQNFTQIEQKIEEVNNTIRVLNISDKTIINKNRQVCWRLPKRLEPSIELLENQILRFVNILPEFLQTIVFGRIDDRKILMNTMWFSSICTMCFLFSFLFLSMGTKRLKQSKHEKEIRARCQQLQQYNNQIELERSTFERQNEKLSDEIDELKNLAVRDTDEDIFELREECTRFHVDLQMARAERDALQQDIDYKQNLIQKHEYDMQRQVETVAHLNNELLQFKQELEKERGTIARLQSNDLSLERFENFQEIIHQLKSEILQLKQEKFTQSDNLQEIQEHSNQFHIENNQLILKMKQLKDVLEQRDQTITRIRDKTNDDELEDINNDQQLLLTIDNDIEKSSQHIRDLHNIIDEKTRRIKELDLLFKQEKDRFREIETKLKVVLELRERDTHLHIRQLGQTDAELRKARTDTERVRILQQQLEFKRQQLEDIQKVLSTEQTKFSEECSKLQHETHEKWMEVKRLTRELDTARKECEGLRRQITKYANNERSSQIKPVLQHIRNNGRVSSEPGTNGSSPVPMPYQQGEKFIPIDHQRNDSGGASPTEMFIPRPPIFGLNRPPFFPPSFLPPPLPNPFMLHPRFSMPGVGLHGMISPIAHLITNGSDTNSFEMIDSENITPNSTNNDSKPNETGSSFIHNDEQKGTKKPKKSLKKKTRHQQRL